VSNLLNSSYEVSSIGEGARGWLSPGQRGEVFAAVSRAVYLLTEESELFWLTVEPGPMHRRCLKLSSPLPKLATGSTFDVQGEILVTSSGDVLDFGQAPVWRAPRLSSGNVIFLTRLPELVMAFYERCLDFYPPIGLGSMIPAILRIIGNDSFASDHGDEDVLSSTAWPAVEGIVQACLSHDYRLVQVYATRLVGLGDGLTPSGDDFLGGLFYGVRLLRQTYPEDLHITNWNYSDFILQCRPLTNLISFTLLKDHADGHTLEPLQCLADSLLTNRHDRLLPLAGELIAVGHSTGWSLLTGFLTGMSVAFSQ
jgi:hypothetical protein